MTQTEQASDQTPSSNPEIKAIARAAAEAVCHEEQMTVWSGEVVGALSLDDFLRDDLSYDEGLELHATIEREIRRIIASVLDHPEAIGAFQATVREEHAKIVEQTLTETHMQNQQWARAAILFAARAVRRGRHLTAAEKLENFRKAMAEPNEEPTP